MLLNNIALVFYLESRVVADKIHYLLRLILNKILKVKLFINYEPNTLSLQQIYLLVLQLFIASDRRACCRPSRIDKIHSMLRKKFCAKQTR